MESSSNAPGRWIIAELFGRAGMLDGQMARDLGVSRRRRRPKSCSAAAIAFSEVHFHFTHLLHALRELDRLQPEEHPPGGFGLDRILWLFLIGKIVTIDEAITVFVRELGKDPSARATLKATKPLLSRARYSIGALKAMRNRWLAHGWNKRRGGPRESPMLARFEEGAPESTEELRFITILYLQYVCTLIVAMPGLLLEASEYAWQISRRSSTLVTSENRSEDFEAEARRLVHDVCSELGIDELPLIFYDADAL